MTHPDSLQRALRRLDAALATLEVAAARRAEAEVARADAEREFAALEDDRCRLAMDLDAALARSRALDHAADDVSARLDRAGEAVRGVLAELADGQAGAGPA